jgi:RPA43 OB domain in RNA Pol I
MSTTKRKHPTPPSPSSKKRKHKHHTPSSVSSEQIVKKAISSAPPQLFQKSRLKIHVAVPPAASTSLSTYIHSYLTSSLLLKHTANGTIVAFSGFNTLSGVGRILDECPFSWSWFEGDIVLFNPRIGQRIKGTVTVSSPDHVALITYALFNVSIPMTYMPEDWRFEESVWIDGEGKVVEGELEFEVTQYGSSLMMVDVVD